MQLPKFENTRKFWTLATAAVAAVSVLVLLVVSIVGAIFAPENRASVVADSKVASSVYNRNLQAIRLGDLAKKASESKELKAVSAEWSKVLKEQNLAIKSWADKNNVQLQGQSSVDNRFQLGSSQVRALVTMQKNQTGMIAKAFLELADRMDALDIEKEVSSSVLRDVFKKIVELDTATTDALTKLLSK